MKDRIQVAVGLGWAYSLAPVAGFAALPLCSESSSGWSQWGMRLGMTGGGEGDEDGVVGFCPVGRFDITERSEKWEKRGMQRWIIQGWYKKGGEMSGANEIR